MRKLLLILFICCTAFTFDSEAQRRKRRNSQPQPGATAATSAADRAAGYQVRQNLLNESLVANVPFRSVGPTVMSGRVVDLAVNPKDPAHFYVAFASGGLWETKNEGASYTPLFDNSIIMTIGDIDVDWNSGTIYLGSGENNSSRSSYAGFGMFKSTDNGKTWENIGLTDSHHIGRVIVHPNDPNTVWVAALGHLYSANEERGIYKTTDGGKNWNKTLFINNETGFTELAIDPDNPDRLLACAWQKDRKAWNFEGAGSGSGIYRSEDGGETWTKSDAGFPQTAGVGRIGLAISPSNSNIVYAVHDNQDRRPKEADTSDDKLTKDRLKSMSQADFLALSNNEINDFLNDNGFPGKYNAPDIKAQVKKGEISHLALVEFIEDANSVLIDTPVKGAEVYKSTDGGKSWTKTHEGNIDNLVFSYGYYFGQIRVDAQNPEIIYTFGVPIITSQDGGKNWKSISGANTHSDHHALWVNPKKPGHLILGNDGGVNISYDDGATWIHTNSLPVGQFYSVNYDMAKPYNVYGGLQDNGVWKGSSNYRFSYNWYSSGNYPYKRIMGGDGMQVAIDTRDNVTTYTGFQFGNYFRINTATNDRQYITPRHELGERPYRWNWQTPVTLSKHNQDILYMGSNKFHRSFNQGDDFETSAQDLTNGGKKGNVSYGTLTSIDESPLKFGLIYTGSDDGLVHVTTDGGYTFKNITGSLPKDLWVTRVDASAFNENRVYLSLNGYRWDNFEAHVYVSENQGNTWKRIGQGLPQEPVNVIKEDPKNENVLYVGTDHGVYVSLDRGNTFMQIGKELPAVPVHDLVIHPRENHLILGTHGRSLYIADVEPVQAMTAAQTGKACYIHATGNVTFSSSWGQKPSPWRDARESKQTFVFFTQNAGKATLRVKNSAGDVVNTMDVDVDKGLNYVSYDFTTDSPAKFDDLAKADNDKYYLTAGKYTLELSANGATDSKGFEVKKPRERPKRKGSE